MKTLNFYYQKRKDKGLRTGVDLNGKRVMEQYEPGDTPPDSALEWFVDLRFRGTHLPQTPEKIRHWLLEHGDRIQSHLEKMALDLRTGIDPGWPQTSEIPGFPKGISAKIVCSAVRRLTCRDIAKVLLTLRESWPDLISSLPVLTFDLAV